MKNTKKILGIVLVVMLLALAMSISAFAATTVTTEEELNAALASGGEVTLGSDIVVNTMIEIPKDVTSILNLNGCKITSGYQAGSDTKHIYPFDVYGNLTIKDETGNGSISGRGIYVQDGSTVTVESGTIYGIDSNGGSAFYQYGGDIVINGGHVEQKAEGTSNFAINAAGGTVTVNGGWIGGNHGAIAAVGAAVEINDGELVCTGTAGMTDNVLYSDGDSTITVNGGTFVADNDGPAGGCCAYDANGGTTINAGNFSNSSGGDVWGTTGTTINGGTFENLIETSHVTVGSTIVNGGVTYTMTENGLVEDNSVAEVNGVKYATFADALTAASAMTGDVVVKIFDKVTLNTALSGNYSSITFVGEGETAEIYLEVQGYITATGKEVAFTDLKLSKSAGGFITNAGFMNVAFGLYDVVSVDYTNCTFLNGAYASSGDVTFTDCTFYRSHDKYGLWAYGDVNAVVDGCTFADYRGIKMYAEDKTKTTDLTVTATDFSAVTDKPAIVLTYGESVTLEGNTYSDTGVFELDLDGAPNGTTVTSTDAITCKNDNGACGVLVDGKIYTTVAQAAEVATSGSQVTLLHNSTETVELPEGVELDKNGFEATGVTVKIPYVAQVGDNYYATLAEALAAVNGSTGNKITLLADASISGQNALDALTGDTLDLNDFTLTVSGNSYFSDGTTTFTNGNIVVSGYASDSFFCGYTAGAVIVFDDVVITGDNYKTGCALFNANQGEVEIKNSEITLSGDTEGGVIYGGSVVIDNTTIDATNVCRGITNSVATVQNDSVFAFDGGETGLNNSSVTVDNSTITIENATKRAVRLGDNTLALVNGATLTATNCAADIVKLNDSSNAVVTVDTTSTLDAVDNTVSYVAEVNGEKFESVLDALAYAIDNSIGTVKILASSREVMPTDVELILNADLTITADAPVEIKFYNDGTTYDFIFNSNNNNTLTIDNNVSFILEDRVIWLGYYGNNVDVVVNGTLSGYQLWVGADLTVNATGTAITSGEALVMRRGATLTVNGGKVDANYFNILAGNIEATNGAVIDSGAFWIDNTGAYVGEGNVEILIKDSTLTSSGNFEAATDASVKVTIDNSTVSFTDFDGYGASVVDSKTTVAITNASNVTFKSVTNDGTIVISEDVNLNTTNELTNIEADVESKDVVYENGKYVFVDRKLAQVGETIYSTLAEALAALKANGGTLVLLDDLKSAITINFPAEGDKLELAIDLNGHTVTSAESTLWVSDCFVVTVKDSVGTGKIVTTSTGDEAIAIARGGKVILESGTVEGVGYGVYLYGRNATGAEEFIVNGGTVTVPNGGTAISVGAGKATVNGGKVLCNKVPNGGGWNSYIYANGTMEITGGEFLGTIGNAGTIAIKGGTFSYCDDPNDGFREEHLAPGYGVTEVDGKFVVEKLPACAKIGNVEYDTIEAALNAVKNGETIVLLADCSITEVVEVRDIAITIEGNYTITLNNKLKVFGETTLNITSAISGEVWLDDGAILKDSYINGNVFVAGNVTFRGENSVGMIYDYGVLESNYGTSAPMAWTVEKGASLEIRNKARYGLGYGDKVTIYGTIEDALTARENLTEGDVAFFAHGLVAQESSGWNKNNYFTVEDAYVVIGSNNSFGNKPGDYGGNYSFIFNNVVLDASRITFYSATSKTELNFTDCDVVTGTFMTRDADSVFVLTNTKLLSQTTSNGNDEGNYNEGVITLINSVLTYSAQLTNNGTINLDVNSCLTAPSIIGTGKFVIDVTGLTTATTVIKADMSGFTGTIELVNGNADYEITAEGVVVSVTLAGSGTEADPFVIGSVDDLFVFANMVNSGNNFAGQYVKLTQSIDLGTTVFTLRAVSANWTAIGTKENPFKGTFDGNDETISNLIIAGEANQGFFGYATEATIKNIKINNVTVIGTDCVGAIVGQGYASTYIDNCHVSGNIQISGYTNVGGIVGKYYARVTNSSVIGDGIETSFVEGIYLEADLEGDNVGGIMGHAGEDNNHSGNTVKNITVSGTRKIGGLIGTTDRATDLTGCTVENVAIKSTATADYVAANTATATIGGLIGNYYGGSTGGTVTECTVKSITFDKGNALYAGPIVGGNRTTPGEAPTGVTTDANVVELATITGANNYYLMTVVAQIGDVKYATLKEAIAALKDGDTLTIFAGEYSEGTIKFPPSLNNVTIKGENGAILKDMTLMASDGSNISYTGITFDGITFDNSNILFPGQRASAVFKNWTIKNCTFKNVARGNAAINFNLNTSEAMENFTFTGNTINGVTGGNYSGLVLRASKGTVVITNNNVQGADWNAIQLINSTADTLTIENNTFASGADEGVLNLYGVTVTELSIKNNKFLLEEGQSGICYLPAGDVSENYWGGNAPANLPEGVTCESYYADAELTELVVIAKPVAQIGDVKFTSLQEAVDYAIANGGVVTLLDNLTLDATVVVNGDVVIDLATYTVSLTSDKYNCVFNIENGNVTIKNGTVSTTETQAIYAGLDGDTSYAPFVTLENVTLVGAENGLSVFGGANVAFNGKVTIKGGVEALRVWNSAVVTVNNGVTIECTGNGEVARAIAVYESANVTIVGGEILGVVDAIAYNDQTPTLTITGGSFSVAPSEYVTENYSIIKDFNNLYVVGVKPTATVNNLGALVVPGGSYTVLNRFGNADSASNAADMPLSFVMQYIANESAEAGANSSYADWYADFVISVDGLANGSFKGEGCYLAGYYGSFGWWKIPIDALTIEEGVNYPVMLAIAGNGQKYDYICSGVADFQCALYLTPEVLAENPDLKVSLDLCVVDSSAGGEKAAEALVNTNGTYSEYTFESATKDFVNEEFVVDYVAKVGDKMFTSLQEAIDYAATVNGTVTLVDDVIATESINVTGTVTLDLAGYTISMEDASGKGAYLIKNTGDLTIKDSSENGTGKITFVSTTPSANFGYSTSTIGNAGNLTVESGTIENTTNGGASYAIDTIWYNKDVSITINGGVIKAIKVAIRQVPYSTTYKNVVNIVGGEISGYAALQTFNTSSIAANLAEVNISGGILTGTYAYYTSYTANNTHAGTDIEITGGTFNGYLYIYNAYAGSSDTQFANVTISGGTFNDGAYIYTKDSASTNVAIPSITGGTYANDVSDYCKELFECVANEDGTYGVQQIELPKVLEFETSLILGNDFQMSFYMPTKYFVDGVDYYAMITKHHANGCGDADVVVYVPIDKEYVYNSNWYGECYKVVARDIVAKEMNCEISCKVFAGTMPEDGAENTGIAVSGTATDSIIAYAEWMLSATSDEKLKTLIVDMLNYGAAAQLQLGHYTDCLANRNLTPEQQDSSNLPDDYEYQNITNMYGPQVNDFLGTFSSISLESSIYMNFYLANVTEEELANMNVVVSFTHHTGKVHEVIYNVNDELHPITVDENGYVKIVVDDLAPADAEIEVFCKVYNGDVAEENLVVTVVDSIESYCGHYANDSAISANLRTVCERIVKYSKSAYAYFHEND